jgi:hypothetical protein
MCLQVMDPDHLNTAFSKLERWIKPFDQRITVDELMEKCQNLTPTTTGKVLGCQVVAGSGVFCLGGCQHTPCLALS